MEVINRSLTDQEVENGLKEAIKFVRDNRKEMSMKFNSELKRNAFEVLDEKGYLSDTQKLIDEFKLITEKKCSLSRSLRDMIVRLIEMAIKKATINKIREAQEEANKKPELFYSREPLDI